MYIKGLNFLELEKANYFKLVGYKGEGVLWKFYNEDDEPLYVDDDYEILLQEKNVLLVKFFVKGRVKIEAYASTIAIIKKAIDLEVLLQDKESVIVPSDNIFKELQAILEAERQQAEYDRLEAERLEQERLEAEKADEEVDAEAEPIEAEGDTQAIEDAEDEAKAPAEEAEQDTDSVVNIVTTDTEIEAEGDTAEPIEEEVEQETEAEPIIAEPELLASLKIEIVVPFGLVSKPSYLCNLFFDTYREFQPLYLEGRLSGADLIVLANRAFITYNILNKGKRLSETLATCMVLAHMISISSNFTSAEGEAGLGGLGFGGISSASLGDVSLSFDSKPIKTMLDSYFSSTPYGLEFLQWYHSRPTLTTIN